jgi:hypothetical protein
MNEKGVRININKIYVKKDEINIEGEKEGVMKDKESIMSINKEMEKKCKFV